MGSPRRGKPPRGDSSWWWFAGHTHAAAVEAVAVIANLVSFERALLTVARFGQDGDDAH